MGLKFDQPYNLIGIFRHMITGNIYCILLDKPDHITTNYRTKDHPFSDVKIDYYKYPSAVFKAFNSTDLFNLGPSTLFTKTYVVFELNNPYNYVLCDRLDLERFPASQEDHETTSFTLNQLWHPSYKKSNHEGNFFMENRNLINGVIANSHCLPGDVIVSSVSSPRITANIVAADKLAAFAEASTRIDYNTISPSDICAGSFNKRENGEIVSSYKCSFNKRENGGIVISNYKCYMIPDIKEIIFDDPATIVYWADETKTIVRVADGEKFDKETGLAMAIAKKYFERLNHEYPRSEFLKAVKNAHIINKAQRKKQRKAEKEAKKNA